MNQLKKVRFLLSGHLSMRRIGKTNIDFIAATLCGITEQTYFSRINRQILD